MIESSPAADKITKLKYFHFASFTHRVRAREVVATHHFHVGLLYQGDPELVPVAGIGAQQLSITIHWQEVIYNHLQQ